MLDAAGRFERDLGDGLAGFERDILGRWDAGASLPSIVGDTGFSAKVVRDVVSLYDDRPDGPRVPAALVVANQAHADAVRRLMAQRSAARPRPLDVDEIVGMLTERVDALVDDLLPNARREGNERCVGSVGGEPGQSLRINVGAGSKRGWWKDFSSHDRQGNALWLIAHVACHGDVKEAVRWAKSWLKIDDSLPIDIERLRIEARAAADARRDQAAAERQKGIDRARSRWLQAQALSDGDPVTRYLRARALDFGKLGHWPGALRYHPALQYGYRADGPQLTLPAMVAGVYALDGRHVATHRTYLDASRDAKAGPDLIGHDARGGPADPKKIMGSPNGGHIPIWKGRHDCPLREIPDGTDVIAGEGIEDSATAAIAMPDARVICFISLSYLAALELPPQMGRLIILKQNDPPGSPAEKAMRHAVQVHRERGRTVLFAPPPAGVKDVNDLAMGKVG